MICFNDWCSFWLIDGRGEVDITAAATRSKTNRFPLIGELWTLRSWSRAAERGLTSSSVRGNSGQKEASGISDNAGQCYCTACCCSSPHHSSPLLSNCSGIHSWYYHKNMETFPSWLKNFQELIKVCKSLHNFYTADSEEFRNICTLLYTTIYAFI